MKRNLTFKRFITSVSILLIFLSQYGVAGDSGFLVVSAEKTGQESGFDIFFQAKINGQWRKAQRMTATDGHELHPAVVQCQNGDVMIAWVHFSGVKGVIQTRLYNAAEEVWGDVVTLETPHDSDITPALASDESGTIWVAFSGAKNAKSDIYICRWDGQTWKAPIRLSRKGGGPTLHPRFSYSEKGALQISWKAFVDGNYTRIHREFLRGRWLPASLNVFQNRVAQVKRRNGEQSIEEVQRRIPPGSQAAVSFGNGEPSVTLTRSN